MVVCPFAIVSGNLASVAQSMADVVLNPGLPQRPPTIQNNAVCRKIGLES